MDEFLNYSANKKLQRINKVTIWGKIRLFFGLRINKKLKPLNFEVPKALIDEYSKLTKKDELIIFYDGTFVPIVKLKLK